MFVNDNRLRMRFKRQPRVVGTTCFYVPTNRLLQTDGLEPGKMVRIMETPQGKNDLFIEVLACDQVDTPENRKSVLWKDLAQ